MADIGSSVRTVVSRAVEERFSRPEADVLSGVLIGGQHTLPPSIRNAFRATGLSHILAVSGEHITLSFFFMETLLSSLGIARRKRCGALILAAALYAVVTGLGASAIRAALMGSSAVIARQLGRSSAGFRALLITGSAMAFVSPSIVRSDLSFQLSFAATAGILFFGERIGAYLLRVPLGVIRALLSQTLAAIVATQPIILSSFGTISLIAPVANIFAVPLVPLIMAFGAFWGGVALLESAWTATGIAAPFLLSPIAALPAWGAVHVLIGVARFFSTIPFAQVTIADGTPRAIALGVVLSILCFLLVQSARGKTLNKK